MCIGPDDGCQDVPDPIAPIDMMFVSLDPTRMPMSLSIMTIKGPIFIEPISIPGMPSIAPGAGLAVGICIPGMFICVCGEADGEGDVCGICIPGMFIGIWGEACGIGMDEGFGDAEL